MKKKICIKEMDQMLSEDKSQKEIAAHFGVSEAAVSKARKKHLRLPTAETIAEATPEVALKSINIIQSLASLYDKTLKVADRVIMAGEKAVAEADTATQEAAIYKSMAETELKAIREIRSQLRLQAELLSTLYNAREIQCFQETVLEVLNEASPAVKAQFVEKLQRIRAQKTVLAIERA